MAMGMVRGVAWYAGMIWHSVWYGVGLLRRKKKSTSTSTVVSSSILKRSSKVPGNLGFT